jgi:hypothetical protein
LTKRTSFPFLKHEGAILCDKDRGPYFGYWGELGVLHEPFNKQDVCRSNANRPGFKIPENSEGINMLTNKKDTRFTISSIEVWGVRFKD